MQRTIALNIRELTSPKRIAVVQLDGMLDDLTTPQIEEPLDGMFTQDKRKDFIIDCLKLSYFNSTGLARLMHYALKLKDENGTFKFVVNPSEFIHEIMEVCGALKVLQVYKNVDDAIESYRK
ncbi:MAG: STAS domain-containing protein [Candidatus Omnitrophica bacterium]|nr:STAS domain-containing protein [Candidatus Omnitrophota bacterium]MDD5655167.1 STAS domain-containing protein [Candidatus Omnitrophota bacterium]